jgi:SAM-dependent methyltransferase
LEGIPFRQQIFECFMKPNVVPANTGQDCRVCGASISGSRKHKVREMYFGSREWFSYVECSSCGSLQIEEIPPDLSRFYPANYYAQAAPAVYQENIVQRARYLLRGQLTLHQLGHRSLIGSLISALHHGKNALPIWLDGRYVNVTLDSRILDAGCGNGVLLAGLRRFGFRRLEGIEPFIKAGIDYGTVKIHRTTLEGFSGGGYDLIMLHHVLEHLPEPSTALGQLAKMLAPGGRILIRIPVAGSYAWRHYGTDWVSLDAPRHLVLYTPCALRQVAERCGLEMCGMYYDSGAFQFWGSEQYRRDIPLEDPRSVMHDRRLGAFTQQEMDEFIRKSEELNQNQEGDQAAFIFKLCTPAESME